MSEHSTRKEWDAQAYAARPRVPELLTVEQERHVEGMRMKEAMERAKELANLVYDGGCEVTVETYEDGYADMREGSAYAAMVKQRTGDMPRVLSELGNDPWQVLDGLLKRLEEAAVAKLHSKRQEAGRAQKKLSEQIKAIEEGRKIP